MLSGPEGQAFAAVATALPGGAFLVGALEIASVLTGGTEPAAYLDASPWARGLIGWGLEIPRKQRLAWLRFEGEDPGPQNFKGDRNPPELYGMRAAEPPVTYLGSVDLSSWTVAVQRECERRGHPRWLVGSSILRQVPSGSWRTPNAWARIHCTSGDEEWIGSDRPVKVSYLTELAESLEAQQNAKSVDSEPWFAEVDLRTWAGGGARQTWMENVDAALAYESGGIWYATPVATESEWKAEATPAAAEAREEWEARRAQMLALQAELAAEWREWRAQRDYSAALEAQLDQIRQQAEAEYASQFVAGELPVAPQPELDQVQQTAALLAPSSATAAALEDQPEAALEDGAPSSSTPLLIGALAALMILSR